MSRENNQMAYIAEITHLIPIEGADAIVKAVINAGWPVVVKKDEFIVGDLVVYCELDSWIPAEIAPFLSKGKEPREYNGVKGERLRSIKLRGCKSQGLVLPMSVLVGQDRTSDKGTLVGDVLGIQKWEEPDGFTAGNARGNFPNFLRKSDQERAQNLKNEIAASVAHGDEYEVTMKLHGSSTTAYFVDGKFGICSRNLDLKLDDTESTFVKTLLAQGADIAMAALGRNIAVQGELMGPKICGNQEEFTDHKFFVYDVFDVDTQEYVSVGDRFQTIAQLRVLGWDVQHVPVISAAMKIPTDDIQKLIEFADGPSINPKVLREGLVWKRLDGKFSFKTVSDSWLLKQK